jgi:tetratricopeptide (TPR) repeat protein
VTTDPSTVNERGAASRGGDAVPGDRDHARQLAAAALRDFAAAKFDDAIEKAQRAYAMVPASTIALLLGRAYKERGDFHRAEQWFERAATPTGLADNRVLREARRKAQVEFDLLGQQFPRVRVEPGPQDVSAASLDGARLPKKATSNWWRVDPGRHLLELEFESSPPLRHVFDIQSGQQRTFEVSQTEGEHRAGAGVWRGAGIASLGVGAAAIGTGVGFALHAQQIDRRLADECLDRSCPSSEEEDVRNHSRARTISTLAYSLGAVATTGGALMIWRASKKDDHGHDLRLVLSHDRVTLKGAF